MIDFKGTEFLHTSQTTPQLNRLNERARILVEELGEHIRGKRVLDLASHDGRFSWAALEGGASRVVGVEAREHLVNAANNNLKNADAIFIQGDVFDYIKASSAASFDTVFCFGFLYHTTKQELFFQEMKRLGVKSIILDTAVNKPIFEKALTLKGKISTFLKPKQIPALVFHKEDHKNESNTTDENNLTARPTESFIYLMADIYGFRVNRLNWNPKSWEDLKDYQAGERESYLITRKEPS